MNSFVALLFSLSVQSANPCLKAADVIDDKAQLLLLERQWLEHEFVLDTAFISTLMDPGFISISESGIKNKQEDLLSMYTIISERTKNGITIDSFKLEDAVVNIYGNSAVVTFIVHTYRKEKTVATEKRTRFYDVWIKKNKQWKVVATQGSPVAE